LKEKVLKNRNATDKAFLLPFENGTPEWNYCCARNLSEYPAIRWKLKNIQALKDTNPEKFKNGIDRFKKFLGLNTSSILLHPDEF
jgi:hypothetical protein